MTIIIRDRVYLPIHKYKENKQEIKELLSTRLVSPYNCNTYSNGIYCDTYREKGFHVCKSCEYAVREVKCYTTNSKYLIFPKGDKEVISKVSKLTGLDIEDRTYFENLPKNLNFDYSKLKEPRKSKQLEIVDSWLNIQYGQIIAPPRSGKTIIGAILTSRLNTKTAIVCHQNELLDQFKNTFLTYTDIDKDSIAINPKSIDNITVALYTWQQFRTTRGKKRLKEIRDKFGLVIVDECHHSSSNIYSTIIQCFFARYMVGLTATPTRPDGLSIRQNLIFGPPTVIGGSEQLSCDFFTVNTNYISPDYKSMNNRTWNYLWNDMAKDNNRNLIIVKLILKAIKNGHKIIIPTKRISQLLDIQKMLPKNINYVILTGKTKNRKEITDNIRNGKYDLVLATAQLISEGFDCPPMSCLVLNAGSYHSAISRLYQEYSRIRTAYEGKKTPMLFILNDESRISIASTKKIVAELKDKGFKDKGSLDGYKWIQ